MTIVLIDGNKTPFDSLSLEQSVYGHQTFVINCDSKQLGRKENYIDNDIITEIIGKEVVIKIEDSNENDAVVKFNGLVVSAEVYKHNRSFDNITLVGKSTTVLADSFRRAETYSDKDLGSISKEVLKPLGKIMVDIPNDQTIEYACQYNESSFQFISRLASKYGHWFYYDGEQTVLGDYQKKETIKMKLGSKIGSYNVSLSMIPVNSSLSHYDYINDEKYEIDALEASEPKLDKIGKALFITSKDSFGKSEFSPSASAFKVERDLKNFVDFEVASMAAKMCQLHGESQDSRIQIGTAIDLIDKQDNTVGTYLVINVSHSCQGTSLYSNSFRAIPANIETPPTNPFTVVPKTPSQVATIKDNSDPDGLGRVKVLFPWQNINETTPWIRVVNPYAGSGNLYFVPEVDDQVMVGFEFDHPDRPYVIGSVYHGKSAPEYFTEKNSTKAIQTKCGHRILFEDGDESQISIVTKDEKHSIVLSLAENGSINISTEGSLNFEAKEMNLKADNINIESLQELNIKGSEIEIEAQQAVNVKGTNASIEGTAEIGLKGAQAKLEGDAMTTIKGGMVKIN